MLFFFQFYFKLAIFCAFLNFAIQKDLGNLYQKEKIGNPPFGQEHSEFVVFFKKAGPSVIPFFLASIRDKKESLELPFQGETTPSVPNFEIEVMVSFGRDSIPYVIKEIELADEKSKADRNYLFLLNQILCDIFELFSLNFNTRAEWRAFEAKKNVKKCLSGVPRTTKTILPTALLIGYLRRKMLLPPGVEWIFPEF